MNPDNARIPRVTAAAGTELADAYSRGTVVPPPVAGVLPPEKRFTGHGPFFPHATWLVQALAH